MASTTMYKLLLILMSTCHQACSDASYADQDVVGRITPNQSSSPLPTSSSRFVHGSSRADNRNQAAASSHNQGSICAYYDDHPTSNRDDYSKNFYTADGKAHGGRDSFTGEIFPDNNTVRCLNYCFTLWVADHSNKSAGTVSKQGCWIISEGKECLFNNCISNLPPRPNNTHFCCCSGHMCNKRYMDVYNPAEHTTTTTHAAQLAVGTDKSYKIMTITIALVSVISVSVVIMFLYLAYRLLYLAYRVCLNLKPTSLQSSSMGGAETPEPLLPEFNVDDLKVQDVLVRGRYSEIRKGWLRDKEVAVKIYQPHHRQYYYNERNAFTQPFMDHENLVKFFGAKEQEDPETNVLQYIIVTEYMTLGSLTSYLKHNTVNWSMLCHMCQGISRGLAHLHTDIQKADLFKPAIAHRDLNTRNILVTPDLTCVIADLGFAVGMIGSKIIKNGIAENAEQATLADVGTLRYMAPEVFDGAVNLRDCEASLKQIDVYALGLVIWEIASRCVDLYQGAPVPEYQLPFQAEAGAHPTFEEMQVLVVKYKTRPRFPEVWKDANPAVRSLKETIEDCWDTDAEARLTSLCVQERVTDMAALWAHGNKHRGVMPTLNTTLNLPEVSQNSVIHSGSAVVSNGVTYLPSYVDRNNETNEEVGDLRVRDELKSSVIPTSLRTYEGSETLNPAYHEDNFVTAPLISNVVHLDNSDNFEAENSRVRSWLQDQSMSGSTMDTMLPPTPSFDNAVLDAPADLPPVKASNVMIAINKAVILHPNQGRNPTVERNTHKRSDEELTVSGNVLVGPGNQVTNSEVDRSNRRGSFGARSAPPNRNGDGGSFDGTEAVEFSSLVQNDSLGQYHIRPRNMPIPYFQNHVHGDNIGGVTTAPLLTRPKLANVSGNRNSYLRLQGEDASPQPHTASFQTAGKVEANSLKHKLSRFIRPKDFGLKISQMVFGKREKKSQDSYTTANSFDVESVMGRGEDGNRVPGQYVNNGLDASPVSRNMVSLNTAVSGTVPMEVQILNGSYVTRAYNDMKIDNPQANQSTAMILDPQGRPSATNVMRFGILANPGDEELASPSLFPKSGTSSFVNEPSQILTREQEHSAPLHNLVTTDYGSMHPVILNQAYGIDNDADASDKDLKMSLLLLTPARSTDVNETDYHLSGRGDGSNLNLYLTSLNFSNNYSGISSWVETCINKDREPSASSDSGCNVLRSAVSNIPHTESSLVSATDPDILNTVIQSPQNKTIIPLNKPMLLSSFGGYNPKVTVKGAPQDTSQGPHSSQNLTTCHRLQDHHTDTKGGNSIMHNTHMEPNKAVFKDSSRSSGHPALKPVQLQNTRAAMDAASHYSKGKLPISSERLSPSKDVTDQQRHLNQPVVSHNSDNPVNSMENRNAGILPEIDINQNFNSSEKTRPKSLSLKGHNYNRSRSRGRSVSSSSLVIPLTSEAFLLTNSSKKTKDGVGLMTSAASNLTLNMTSAAPNLTLDTSAAPNVTLNKISLPIQDSSSAHWKAPVPTTVAVPTSTDETLRTSDSSDNSADKISMNNCGITSNASSVQTGSNFSSVENHQENSTVSSSNTATLNSTSDKIGSKQNHSLMDRSDSSEKIRKRIKTPVSFKKNRLSLYDDRLMTQSLGFVSLSDVDRRDILGERGDNNNNSSQTGLCSRHQDGGGGAQGGKSDYYKMIKSESDLVV